MRRTKQQTKIRPISNLTFMSESGREIDLHQLTSFLNENLLLSSLQSAYRTHHSRLLRLCLNYAWLSTCSRSWGGDTVSSVRHVRCFRRCGPWCVLCSLDDSRHHLVSEALPCPESNPSSVEELKWLLLVVVCRLSVRVSVRDVDVPWAYRLD